jgi:hypothetical protein
MPVRIAKTTAKTGGVLLGMLGAVSVAILAGETKRGCRS